MGRKRKSDRPITTTMPLIISRHVIGWVGLSIGVGEWSRARRSFMRAAMRSRLNVDLVSKIMVYPRDGHNHRPSSDGMMSIFYHFLEELHGLVVENFCVLWAFLEPSFFQIFGIMPVPDMRLCALFVKVCCINKNEMVSTTF